MAAKNTIKKDSLGLYTICGGYVSRPFFGTIFKEGDDVKTHHFGGSTMGGVTSPDKPETHHFKRSGQYEIWSTTGVSSTDYRLKKIPQGDLYSKFTTFDEYLNDTTKWYKDYNRGGLSILHKESNKKFQK